MSNILPFTPPVGAIPPPDKFYNLHLECGMIGALLRWQGAYAQVAPTLKPSHFHEAFLGEVYAWIGGEVGQGADGGEVLQMACLQAVAHKDKGKETIAHCIGATLVPLGVVYGAKKLVELAEQRRFKAVAERLSEDALHGGSETLVADAIELMSGEDGAGQDRCTEFDLRQAFEAQAKVKERRVYAGSDRLDRPLGGLRAGQFYVIGGRPGSGKSTVALSLLLQTAKRGHGVGFFSLEMTAGAIACRAAADFAYTKTLLIPYSEIEAGELDQFQQWHVDDARSRLGGLPFIVNDKAGMSVPEIKLAAMAMQQKIKIDVLLVDHLGLVRPSGNYRGNKVAETGEVSSGLRNLAKDLDVAVIAVCQLNRQVEGRENKKPTLADLRWAGEIEQDADVVMMIYREAYYLEEGTGGYEAAKNRLEILIRKNRAGATGRVDMFAEMAASHVRDLDKEARGNE